MSSEGVCSEGRISEPETETLSPSRTIINQRWLGLRLDFFGTILTFVVAIIAVTTSETINPSQIGLVLSYILAVQMSFTWAVRQFAEVENDMNSVERLLHYSNELEQEAAFEVPDKKPPAQWPQAGAIEFNDVKLRYRPGLPLVLHGLSMSVKGGEKIGVVGRTGAVRPSTWLSQQGSRCAGMYRLTDNVCLRIHRARVL